MTKGKMLPKRKKSSYLFIALVLAGLIPLVYGMYQLYEEVQRTALASCVASIETVFRNQISGDGNGRLKIPLTSEWRQLKDDELISLIGTIHSKFDCANFTTFSYGKDPENHYLRVFVRTGPNGLEVFVSGFGIEGSHASSPPL
jgi:hypothetical protein